MGENVSIITNGQRTERRSERLDTRKTAGVDMNSRKFKAAMTRASNYTDDNDHNKARATIAKAFGYNDLEKNYRDIERDHVRAGYLTEELSNRRNANDDELERRIRRDYGERGIKAYSGRL